MTDALIVTPNPAPYHEGPFPFIPYESLRVRTDDPRPVVEGLIPHHGVTVMHGQPGKHKTRHAIDMGTSIAMGVPWRGRKTYEGRVVFVFNEKIRETLTELEHHMGENPTVPVSIAPQGLPLFDTYEVARFILTLQRYPDLRLVVLDSLDSSVWPANLASEENRKLTGSMLNWMSTVLNVPILAVQSIGYGISNADISHFNAEAEIKVTLKDMRGIKRKDGTAGAIVPLNLRRKDK